MEKFQARLRKLHLDHNPLRRHTSRDASGDAASQQSAIPKSHNGLDEFAATTASTMTLTLTSTPPIAVPPPRRSADHLPLGNDGASEDYSALSTSGRYLESNYTISPIEVATRQNRSTISFEPGPFSASYKKPSHLSLGITIPRAFPLTTVFPRNHNDDPEVSLFEKKEIAPRARTEATRLQNHSVTEQTKSAGKVSASPTFSPTSVAPATATATIEPRDEDGLAPTGVFGLSKLTEHVPMIFDPSSLPKRMETSTENSDAMRIASLIPDAGSSPPSEVLLTPPTNPSIEFCEVPCGSPISRTHSFQDQTSLRETSLWPRKLSTSQRNRSYNIGEQPPTSRRRSRRISDGSASAGSTRMSPASAFLGCWGTVPAPDPDAEGQEIGPYVVGRQIGYGGFSVVKEVTTIKNGIRIKRAVKIVRKKVAHTDEAENERIQVEFDHEVAIWRYLAHPYILPLIEVYDTPFATYCFTRLATGGTLFDLVKTSRKQGLPIQKAQKFAYQLASAIRYLHEDVRIIHRDIKLENCLIDVSVDEEGSLLLCDFGMAEQMVGSNDDDSDSDGSNQLQLPKPPPRRRHTVDDYNDNPLTTPGADAVACYLMGSLHYASPELVTYTSPPPNSPRYKSHKPASTYPPPHLSSALDIWAYGVCCFALHTGFLPFNHSFQPKLQMMIAKAEWDVEVFRESGLYPSDPELGEDALEVVSGCLQKNVGRRWRIGEVLESRWLAGLGFEEEHR